VLRLELPLLVGAALLEGAEVLLDAPAGTIAIDDRRQVRSVVDRLRGDEAPLDGLDSGARADLADADDVDPQGGGKVGGDVLGAADGDACRADAERRSPARRYGCFLPRLGGS